MVLKKIIAACTCAALLAAMAPAAFAETADTTPAAPISAAETVENINASENYNLVSGKVSSIDKTDNGYRIEISNDNMGMVFNLESVSFVYDQKANEISTIDKIEKDMMITAIIENNAPMTMSIPPQTSGVRGFVLNSDAGSTDLDVYNDDLTNKKNTLKLNISETTKIFSANGSKILLTTEDLKNAEILVLYTASTRSIPAQTNPEAVILLTSADELSAGGEIENKAIPESVVMVPVRTAAEELGYTVTWTSHTEPVLIEKDNVVFQIKLGETAYTKKTGDQVENGQLAQAVELHEDGHMMVPESFAEILK